MAKLYTKNPTWVDEVLADIEKYEVKNDSDVVVYSNAKIALSTPVVIPGTSVGAAAMNNLDNGVDALDTLLDGVNGRVTILEASANGWSPIFQVCTYVSATSFTIAGNYSNILQKGDKIRVYQTTWKYVYVLSAVYSSPNTTVTIIGNSLVSAAMTDTYYSHSNNPVGFPHWFDYTPTGIAASNVILSGRFSIIGRTCKVQFRAVFTGGITFTTMPTLPIAVSSNILDFSVIPYKPVGYLDSGTSWVVSTLYMTIAPSATTFSLKAGTTDMSATNPITWANGDNIGVEFEYEI